MIFILAILGMQVPQAADPAPLPDISMLMHQVEAHQREAEKD